MIYGIQNAGYQMPSPYPNMMAGYGGYPYGYPPSVPQNMGYGAPMMTPAFGSNQIPMMSGYGNNIVPSAPIPMTPQNQQQTPGPKLVDPNEILKQMEESGKQFNPLEFGMEVEFKDGTKQYIPPQNAQPVTQSQMSSMGFTPGGARVSQGGFNPVNGTMTPQAATPGFNPYGGNMAVQQQMQTQPTGNMVVNMINQSQSGPVTPVNPSQQFIGNPGYQYQQPMRMPNPSNFGMGFAPYSPPGVDPYAFKQPWQQPGFMNNPMAGCMGMYPFNGAYGQNQFNTPLQDFLYNEEPSAIDAKSMLASIMLSDEEKERIGRNTPTIQGYDYFGRPIYSSQSYYNQQMQQQQQFEEARHNYQSYFTHLSKIAHAYSGETIDEEAMMKRFDPVPPPPPPPKIFNPMTATPEEKKAYEKEQQVYASNMLANYADNFYGQLLPYQDNCRSYMYAQVKASHDKLIGVEPGQHYDLKTFMDNGYKIGVDIAMRKAKEANRNGTTKYSRVEFRNYMNNDPLRPNNPKVPVMSSDDEYISIEDMLKRVYTRNKGKMIERINQPDENNMTLVRDNNGKVYYTSDSPAVISAKDKDIDMMLNPNASEYEAHMFFLKSIQDKKDREDAKKNLR